jgi:hypothetical protein
MPKPSFDMFQACWAVYWRDSLWMLLMHWCKVVTIVVVLHHVWMWHVRWWIRIHSDRMIARKMVDEMTG